MIFKNNKLLLLLILFTLIFSQFTYNVKADYKNKSLSIEELSFKQEITLPIDTSLLQSKYYPVDIKISFDNPCWAKDTTNHSIRIGSCKKNIVTELESQIYNLEFTDENHIKSCKIVFLIPENTDGSERYYIFYDESETTSVTYTDHLNLFETSYYYEPIQGEKIDFDCYQIEQEGEILYLVVKQGEILGYPFSNVVIRLKPDSREPRIEYLDQICDFSIDYGITNFPGYIGTAYAKNPSKKTIVDGNLMVRLEIESVSPQGDLKTRNVYTYYFCPDTTRRIFTDVYHEVLKDVKIDNSNIHDGSYAGLVSLKARSKSIDALNIGEFYPMLALVNENDIVEKFDAPLNPRTGVKDFVLTKEDDADLGKSAWMCFYDPLKGKTHGLILSSNSGIVENSSDGAQVTAWVEENIKLPGLEGGSSNLYAMKNSYEKGGEHETTLSKGHTVSFQSLFVSIEQQDYTAIIDESNVFQEWIKKTSFKDGYIDSKDSDETEFYNITAFVNFAPSVPFGVLLSAITGKNISFISAELYKEENFRSACTVTRIPLHRLNIDFQEADLKTILGLFDIKNASFSKKIVFPDVEPGKYVIKIYKENPFFSNDKKFIGFGIVDVADADLKTRIICSTQSNINCFISDSSSNPLKDVSFYLEYENSLIEKSLSDTNGSTVLSVPCILKNSYCLKAYYNGFLIAEEEINLKMKNIFLSLDKTFEVSLNSFLLNVKDSWGLPLEVDTKPFLTSEAMVKPVLISGEKTKESNYLFEYLPSSEYLIKMSYKSLDFEKNIKICNDEKLDLVFPGEFRFDINVFDNAGETFNSGIVKIEREDKTKTISVDDAKEGFYVPPGTYIVSVLVDNNVVSKQIVVIHGDKELDAYTSQDSFLHLFLTITGVLLVFVSLLFIFFKKQKSVGFKLLIIGLLIVSLALPWWSLAGKDTSNSINTKTFLIPNKMINSYEYNNYIFGDASQVPDEFYMVLFSVSFVIVLTCFLVLLSIFLKKKYNKINIFITLLTTIFLIVSITALFYTMSLVTYFGLGSVIGNSEVTADLPWDSISYSVNASWGFDIGFYLVILAIGINLFYLIARKRLNF
jgi:hypothetical protein